MAQHFVLCGQMKASLFDRRALMEWRRRPVLRSASN